MGGAASEVRGPASHSCLYDQMPMDHLGFAPMHPSSLRWVDLHKRILCIAVSCLVESTNQFLLLKPMLLRILILALVIIL
jgi:hypothetical protein